MAKTQKMPRDPNAPRRNVSAYLLYQNAMRETFRAQHPSKTFGELSKHTSAMYARLTPEEKYAWQERAEADKARYLRELSTYQPPPGYDASGNFILRTPVPTKKKERDPGAPKRNLSAYLLYQNAMRDEFRRDNPGMSFGQLSKYTSHMYKSLTPEEKEAWEYRAEQDKIRYQEEMKTYIPPEGYDPQGNLLIEYKIARKNSRKVQKDPNAPKRARGSYVLFTQDYRPTVLAENPGIKFTELGTVLGQKWRNLSAEERRRYDELAQDDKMRFAAEMEVYKSEKEQENVQNNHHQQQESYNYQPHPAPQNISASYPPQVGADTDVSGDYDHHHSLHYSNIINNSAMADAAPLHHEMNQYNQSIESQFNTQENRTSNDFVKLEGDQQLSQIVNQHMQQESLMSKIEEGIDSEQHHYDNSTAYENLVNGVRGSEVVVDGMGHMQHNTEQCSLEGNVVASIQSTLDAHLPSIEHAIGVSHEHSEKLNTPHENLKESL